jgi:hypothetical protein
MKWREGEDGIDGHVALNFKIRSKSTNQEPISATQYSTKNACVSAWTVEQLPSGSPMIAFWCTRHSMKYWSRNSAVGKGTDWMTE